MNTEERFYKAFGIEPTYKSGYCDCDTSAFCPFSDDEIIKPDCKDCGYWEIEELPRQITPEIILKLEEIILKKEYDLIYDFNPAIGYCLSTGRYSINFPSAYECITRIEALLEVCIQLKDEIQEEVKAVFNDK